MVRFPAVLALIIATLALPAHAEGDAVRGGKLAYTCLGCHGIDNYKNAYPKYSVPRLGGQNALYVAVALNEYAEKARWHPTMRGLAMTLTDRDRLDIGEWFASRGQVDAGAVPKGTAPAAAATCAACHGSNGVGLLPEYPTIAGQHADYLARALNDYRSGKRHNAVMSAFAAALTEADIKALSAWFAAQPGLVTSKR